MANIGLISYYPSIEMRQDNDEIFIFVKSYEKSILEKFNMKDYNYECTPIDHGVELSKYNSGS